MLKGEASPTTDLTPGTRTKPRAFPRTALLAAFPLFCAQPALAHGIAEQERQRMLDGGFADVIRIGAEHMLTGYDHLLFLLGAVLLLATAARTIAFVTAFTLGHAITLLGATLLGIRANAHLIDAAIALTVVYVAFENLHVFRRLGLRTPNIIAMVFVFGLVHGFGLSTRLQELTISADPQIVSKIFAFNLGVELGQVAALIVMLGAIAIWRDTPVKVPASRAAHFILIAAGAALFFQQIHQFLTTRT